MEFSQFCERTLQPSLSNVPIDRNARWRGSSAGLYFDLSPANGGRWRRRLFGSRTVVKGQFLQAAHPQTPAILIVDDNRVVTRAMTVLVRAAGYEPVACHTGAEAMAYTESTVPAAAVIDIHLPDINGLVLSQKLRERLGPDAPIIVV